MAELVYGCAPGLRLEALGAAWLVFSPLSCETMQVNDETAVILDALGEEPASLPALCRRLAEELEQDEVSLARLIEETWPTLAESGLIVELPLRLAA